MLPEVQEFADYVSAELTRLGFDPQPWGEAVDNLRITAAGPDSQLSFEEELHKVGCALLKAADRAKFQGRPLRDVFEEVCHNPNRGLSHISGLLEWQIDMVSRYVIAAYAQSHTHMHRRHLDDFMATFCSIMHIGDEFDMLRRPASDSQLSYHDRVRHLLHGKRTS